MIWFDNKKIESQISENRLSEKDGYSYFFASTIYGYILLMYTYRVNQNRIIILIYLAQIVITATALPVVYKINCDLDDKDFLKRYMAITWNVRIKILLWYFVANLIYNNVIVQQMSPYSQTAYVILNAILTTIAYYILTIRSFKRLTVQ